MPTENHTLRLLKWIERYPGWWYLICTPNEKHLTLRTMQMLIEKLHETGLDELIFVLFMVHRDESMMKTFPHFALLDRLVDRWEQDREQIIGQFIRHFD